MSETEVQRQKLLRVAGRDLIFTGFTIKGLSGFVSSALSGIERSPYKTVAQNFTFTVSVNDCLLNNVARNDEFSYTDGSLSFSFIISNMIPDLEGFYILQCELMEVSDV